MLDQNVLVIDQVPKIIQAKQVKTGNQCINQHPGRKAKIHTIVEK